MKCLSITFKLMAVSITGCILVTALTIGMMNFIVENYVKGMEVQDISDTYSSLELILKHEEEDLKRINQDWAHWDDTYAYMAGEKKDYEKANLGENTIRQLNLNFMIFFDMQGGIVNRVTQNMAAEELDSIISKIIFSGDFQRFFANNSDAGSGLISAGGKIFLVSLAPITMSNEQGTSNGVLVFGRAVDSTLFYYMNSVTKTKISMAAYLGRYVENERRVDRDNGLVIAEQPINDIWGHNDILVKIAMLRNDYQLGRYYIRVFAAISSVVVSVVFLFLLLLIYTYCVKRLKKVHQFIDTVTNRNPEARLYISGRDEIAGIACSINEMLDEITKANTTSQKVNERVQSILEATQDGYLEYNFQTKEYYVSPQWSRFFADSQTAATDPLGVYMSRIHPDFKGKVAQLFNELFYEKQDYAEAEYKIIDTGEDEIWVVHKGKVIERDANGKAVRISSMLLNVTARKEYENKILRLSYYDKLTNLCNRAYMEEQFSEIEQQSEVEYHIIMGDVNGLKLVNDTFGHFEGDRLIKTVGKILAEACGSHAIAARWGGDEFIILSINKESDYVLGLMRKIQEECAGIKDFRFTITMALGHASSREQSGIEAVMNLAEERMYRRKLVEENSARNATIASLERTLYEKSAETEAHTQRIKHLAVKLGEKLDLPHDQLCELELLSLLHDIGKIGIPESILLKPGSLTEKEWEVMKQHTEIGHRIAMATPGLSHVAKEILCHHERFDGTGYPQGIKGEKIPLLSRIINIVDSFDVITHKRNYKEALTLEYALGELDRCAGTQFDPDLVVFFKELLREEGIIDS
ncbi:MAG: diguanylate cyclase [Pelosinus sp.]|nr:diguanylate cyclase [Pelosinus sp.]